jgi:hypothetical protein
VVHVTFAVWERREDRVVPFGIERYGPVNEVQIEIISAEVS